MTKRFDAILFDADGVVQTTEEKWWFALTNLIGTNDPDLVQRFLGDIMYAELPALAGTTNFLGPLAEVLRLWQVTTPASKVLGMWQHIDVDSSMIAAIREFTAQGVRCALATNQHPERPRTCGTWATTRSSPSCSTPATRGWRSRIRRSFGGRWTGWR
jgi:putative hydrolase of the HAD superfamily